MWTLKSIFVLVVKATVAMTFATAFSPLSTSPSNYKSASSRAVSPRSLDNIRCTSALHYSRGYNDNVDVDVTDTPIFPLTTTTRLIVERRPSPVIALQSIEDYRKHVLRDNSYNRDHKNDTNNDQLCIVRFSAPWCKACKATNVAWERMTTKLTSHTIASSTNNNIGPPFRFYEVVIGPAGSSSVALKDMLGVDHIPQGIIHHPSRGLFGRKVDLNRSNLSLLKKQLESNSIDRLDTLLRGMD